MFIEGTPLGVHSVPCPLPSTTFAPAHLLFEAAEAMSRANPVAFCFSVTAHRIRVSRAGPCLRFEATRGGTT